MRHILEVFEAGLQDIEIATGLRDKEPDAVKEMKKDFPRLQELCVEKSRAGYTKVNNGDGVIYSLNTIVDKVLIIVTELFFLTDLSIQSLRRIMVTELFILIYLSIQSLIRWGQSKLNFMNPCKRGGSQLAR